MLLQRSRSRAASAAKAQSFTNVRDHTTSMRTAVSIPNDVFDGAERFARITRRSRSRLFTDALREYLARHVPDRVSESMNRAIMEIGGEEGEFAFSAARRALAQTEW